MTQHDGLPELKWLGALLESDDFGRELMRECAFGECRRCGTSTPQNQSLCRACCDAVALAILTALHDGQHVVSGVSVASQTLDQMRERRDRYDAAREHAALGIIASAKAFAEHYEPENNIAGVIFSQGVADTLDAFARSIWGAPFDIPDSREVASQTAQTLPDMMGAALDEWMQASMTWRNVTKNLSTFDRMMPDGLAAQRMYDAGKMLAFVASLGNPSFSEGEAVSPDPKNAAADSTVDARKDERTP